MIIHATTPATAATIVADIGVSSASDGSSNAIADNLALNSSKPTAVTGSRSWIVPSGHYVNGSLGSTVADAGDALAGFAYLKYHRLAP